jgi:hypothetical protein
MKDAVLINSILDRGWKSNPEEFLKISWRSSRSNGGRAAIYHV